MIRSNGAGKLGFYDASKMFLKKQQAQVIILQAIKSV